MGSKVAFKTKTGACITEGRLDEVLAGILEAVASGTTPPNLIFCRGRKPFLCRWSMCAAGASLKVFLDGA
jgi:hypothetical protein